jgi:CDGSH-type Zn-finger protein
LTTSVANKHHVHAYAKVQVTRDGPYQVFGNLPLAKAIISTNEKGESVRWEQGQPYPAQGHYALCRCGASVSKPFCDGSHATVGFNGTETARRQPYLEQSEVMRGPALSLTDAQRLCAFARFCDRHGRVWNLVGRTDTPTAQAHFVRETGNCPSGRLVAWDNETGESIEPKREPSIALIEDPARGCSGPVWLRGWVPVIGDDGFRYEVRNRVTLCRCGRSENKPFCDGTHASVKFNDAK